MNCLVCQALPDTPETRFRLGCGTQLARLRLVYRGIRHG
jgi:hypothetical protein